MYVKTAIAVRLTVASFTGGDLGQISVIIALHFQVEDFAFWITGFGDEEFVQESLKESATKS